MFKFKRTKPNKRQEEYMERTVRKFPKVVFYIFLAYFVLFAIYISCFLYFTNTYTLSFVEGTSMQNTLNPNISHEKIGEDFVYLNKRKSPELFDIVVLEEHDKDGKAVNLIKRVIGFGGDMITIKVAEDGQYHVFAIRNGSEEVQMLEESYVKSYDEWTIGPNSSYTEKKLVPSVVDGENVIIEYEKCFYDQFIASGNYQVSQVNGTLFMIIPDNHAFYMGDNRARSSDSRMRGTSDLKHLLGVAEIILPGLNKDGANVFSIKFKSIFGFYWDKLSQFFAR